MTNELHKDRRSDIDAADLNSMREDIERFRILFENSLDLVVEVSLEGEFIYVSPNIKTVLGYEVEEMLHTSIFERMHPDDLAHVEAQFALPEALVTCRYHHKNGSWRWLETAGRDFLTPGGQTHGVMIIRDVTERKQAEIERQRLEVHLRQIQKLEALGTLASGIAHDFNNLLAVIIGYSELAVLDADNPRNVEKHLAQVRAASERAKNLVQQILTFGRKQKQERKPMRLQPVIEESLSLMRHTLPSTIEMESNIDPETSVVLADATQLHQVVMNLCTNAAHAMKNRPGRLALSLKDCDVNDELAKSIPDLQPGHFVQLSISDTGQGMNPEILKRIFEPFFTTKEPGEGTGLGLPVVHGIVREHNGAISIQSEPGLGTTFDVYFPILESAVSDPEISGKPLPRGHGQHILLVDDEPAVCSSLRVLLTRLGYRVMAETNVANALRIFRDSPEDFDLLISDLTMPRMTGIDFAQEILKIKPKIPIVLSSGSSGGLTTSELSQLGIGGLLSKPTSLSALAEMVDKALGGKQTS